ncbi:transcriptional regulator [Candidatus Nomurabacteria bacterium CG_4_9_14_0_2_um_filter_32_10]|uniref:Transcriptional regulator n=1 Tax=Candidatus Nomurabacteria bacterium CG_4_9_14_0_2_um_filter_32_10 TaxID=1974729 RepID=A0A2J0N6G1_9BACT|nr:MAG: transcriptional regulator [Candidatus Nomurabacteria bacterium CG_4_9_14_0_2_um_filter_32_10]
MFMKNNSEQYKKEIIEVIYKISKDKELLGDFIKEILTPREFDNIGVRWQIVKRIAKGEHHQAIAEDLHLGVATVTRGSREMRKKNGGFRRALKVIHR